jgi:hypothetical protein
MKFYSIKDKEFKTLGKEVENPFFNFFVEKAERIAIPENGSSYMASVEDFESKELLSFYRAHFGDMDVQIGYCWGRNNTLNALEWHKSPEINVALEDMVLLLGDMRDMEGDSFDTANLKAFLVKKGEAVEFYQTTLHFCPCAQDNNVFKSVVILPRGTNTTLENPSLDKKLIAKNKWLICHPECKRHVDLGRVASIKGENVIIK